MSYLDHIGLSALASAIDAAFARVSEAIGSVSFGGGVLSFAKVNGAGSGSIDLDATFATNSEATYSISSGGTLTITISSPLTTDSTDITNAVKSLVNGETTDLATKSEVFAHVSVERSGDFVTLYFSDANGSPQASCGFSIKDSTTT